jgi:hypothetical protein
MTTSRTEYGSIDQTQPSSGPLSPVECQQIVDDILDSLKNADSQYFNPSLSAELQIWTELKNREADPTANAIVDMVRAGEKPLHRFFPPSVQTFVGKVDLVSRQQQTRGDGGSARPPSGYGGQGQGQGQGQQSSRYR